MKNAFMIGLGLGILAGSYLIKHCPTASSAFTTAENAVKNKVEDCKFKMEQKKQQKNEFAADNFMPTDTTTAAD